MARVLACLLFLSCLWFLAACQDGRVPTIAEAATVVAPNPPVSGYAFQSTDTQALQDDPFRNPGMLWVDRGRQLWATPPSAGRESCASCHDAAKGPVRTAALRYPAVDRESQKLFNLEARINACRTRHQSAAPLRYESEDLLALAAYLGHLAQGQPVQIEIDTANRQHFEAGRAYFYTRRGQMNLACYHCHELYPGQMLRGDRLSEGHTNGYPTYRLEWQTLGSLHRRLRFCDAGVRAEPLDAGAPGYVELELYLAWRGNGLARETPAVRR